ncbi:hypothetical protein FGL74_00075 [Leuconostoc koreense]|nr:hypothetical protein FGL74_00075 [Leuconostoc mesenteroides]QGM25721.1 hypothetical protein GJV51_06925 [Leuconostoc mesenteroides subsp. mesenteroides]
MKNKQNHVLLTTISILLIIFLVKTGQKMIETKNKSQSAFVSITSNEASSSTEIKNSDVQHSTDQRHVFSVPYGNDMMHGHNSSNVFFTTWSLDDFQKWIAAYENLSYTDKMAVKSTFGTSYTFDNIKINDNIDASSLSFNMLVQQRWFYFNTVADFIEKHGKNADPNNIQ